jgi:hypothetical protein
MKASSYGRSSCSSLNVTQIVAPRQGVVSIAVRARGNIITRPHILTLG